MGVLIARAILFRVYIRAPDVWKLPYEPACSLGFAKYDHIFGKGMVSVYKRRLPATSLYNWADF